MKKKLKMVSLALSVVLSVSLLTGCLNNSSQDSSTPDTPPPVEDGDNQEGPATGSGGTGEKVIKIAFNQPESHPQYKALTAFGEGIYERTNGKYSVEIFPNELLGSQRDTVEQVQIGTIEMSVVACSLMENFNQGYVVFNLPYVFDSIDHQMSVVNDPAVVADLYKSTEDQGMITLAAFHGGVRNVYTKSGPINTPEDLAGLKIRVMESDTNIKMMELMGGTGTPMSQGEVYTAIQSGVLDGGENNELIYSSLKHTEVAPYYSYTQHLMMPDLLIVDTGFYDTLTDEEKDIFQEELMKAVDLEVSYFADDVAAALAEAEAAGAQINQVDIKIFQDRVSGLIEEKLTTDMQKAIYESVLAAR